MAKHIQLLDATLRDGGQCLEDLNKNRFSNKIFTEEGKHKIINLLEESNIEIIEIGVIDPSTEDKSKFAIYKDIQQLSSYLPQNRKSKAMYAGLYIGPDTDINLIPDWNPSLVKGVRVILRYSELQKSLDYCRALSDKGYKVFVQPMLTMRYTDSELDLIINASNKMNAYACYFVDSYGYMQPKDINRLFTYYNDRLDSNIKIGFHAHNNMNLAVSNVLSFINLDTERDLIIDSCATGMGQGAGNLQTEIILPYLNENYGKQYDYNSILDICDILDSNMISQNLWGYSVTNLLPAIHKTAYKYSMMMRNKYKLTFKDINRILKEMPNEMRNRYTIENLESLLKNKLK